MDHRAFIKSLPRDLLRELKTSDNRIGLLHLSGHVGLILFLATWIAKGWPLWWAAIAAQGIVICFLFTLEHEATHKTPFATSELNEWVGRFAGLLIFLPFEWFRHFHLAHHKFTNIPGKDPELLSGAKPETRLQYAKYVSGLTYWTGMAGQIFSNVISPLSGGYVPKSKARHIRLEACLMLIFYVIASLSLFFSPFLFWVWLLPILLGQPFLRLYLLAEHGRCAFVANMFENTRTTYTNRFVRFLAWNMPYHVEHHSIPQVPFHKLPELHDLMQGKHKAVSNSYSEFTAEFVSDLR
ncbi:MAG: fatty acid desaturase [Pseudomonadota bacterium]